MLKFIVTLEYKNEIWVSFVRSKDKESIDLPLVPKRFKVIKIEEIKNPFQEW